MRTKLLNRTKLASALAISFMVGVPSVASAADFFSSDNPVYAGIGYGQATFDAEFEKFDKPTSSDEKDKGMIFFIGKQYNKNLDIEVFYSDLGDAKGNYQTDIGPVSIKINTKVYGVRTNYKFEPISGFIPYVTLGFGKATGKLTTTPSSLTVNGERLARTESDTGAVYGVGAQYKYSKDITLRGEFSKPEDDTQFMYVGVSTSF